MNDDETKAAFREIQRQFREGESKVLYPDLLSEPIYIDPAQWPSEAEANSKIRQLTTRAQRQYREGIDRLLSIKWDLLFYLYGIETKKGGEAQAWEALARALVGQHVPGFAVTNTPPKPPKKMRGRGQPKKYERFDDAAFIHIVELCRQEMQQKRRNATLLDAIRHGIKHRYLGKYALKPNGDGMDAKSVQSRYYEALARWKEEGFFNKELLKNGRWTPQTLAANYIETVMRYSVEDHK